MSHTMFSSAKLEGTTAFCFLLFKGEEEANAESLEHIGSFELGLRVVSWKITNTCSLGTNRSFMACLNGSKQNVEV